MSAIAAIEAQGVPDGWRELMSEALDNALASTVEEGISHDRRNYRRELAQRIKQALNASAPPAPQATRCELCQYQHGHQIGCANNPVDIALKAQTNGYGQKLTPQASGFEQPAVVKQEPKFWAPPERDGAYHAHDAETVYRTPKAGWYPLYTHNAQQAKPQPLSDEQRRRLIDMAGDETDGLNQDDFADAIISAVERHYGIKE